MLAGDGAQVADPFDAVEAHTWTWTRSLTRAALLDMAASRSYVITAPDADRTAILAAVSALFDERRLTDATGAEVVDLPYVTRAFRSIRP
jgi:hypothetical protein